MRRRENGWILLAVVGAALGIASPGSAEERGVSINYERLSSFEEPLATEIGDVTLVLTGVVDSAWSHDLEDDDANAGKLTGNFELSALTQLPNRWRLGLRYFGQYEVDGVFGSGADGTDGAYTDNGALSVGGVWGTALFGNVSGAVREQTRRVRGAGNAALAFDGFRGGLDKSSAGYSGRFGPWVVGAVLDGEGKFDLGTTFRRPAGNREYRVAMRGASGTYRPADGRSPVDTGAVGAVGEVIHGSMSADIGAGYERYARTGPDIDRWFLSSGVRWKTGAVTVSLEGHYGRIDDEDEVSAALGVRYDIARGLSANFGLNHADARLEIDGEPFVDAGATDATVSLRFDF